jgi:hypothetical protein
VLVDAHMVVLFSLVLSAASTESAVAAGLAVLVAGAAVAMTGTAITKARALAGHAAAAVTLGRDSKRIALGRSRSGLGDKSGSRECSGGGLTAGGGR